MSSIAEVSLWFLWVLVIVLWLLVLLLYRQWGLSLVRPSDRFSRGGIDVGARAPRLLDLVVAADPAGVEMQDEWGASNRVSVAVFVIPNCPVCTDLKRELRDFEPTQRWPENSFVLVERIPVEDAPSVQRDNGYVHIRLRDPDGVHFAAYDVQQAPFAYVISPDRRIQAKGLVNSVEALEVLLGGAEGHSSDRKVVHHDDA